MWRVAASRAARVCLQSARASVIQRRWVHAYGDRHRLRRLGFRANFRACPCHRLARRRTGAAPVGAVPVHDALVPGRDDAHRGRAVQGQRGIRPGGRDAGAGAAGGRGHPGTAETGPQGGCAGVATARHRRHRPFHRHALLHRRHRQPLCPAVRAARDDREHGAAAESTVAVGGAHDGLLRGPARVPRAAEPPAGRRGGQPFA